MSIIGTAEYAKFDHSVLAVRDFLRAQYHTWPEPRNGMIVSVSEDKLTALFLPAIHQSACYFHIKASEVKDGKWKVCHISFPDDGWYMSCDTEDFADEYTGENASGESGVDTPEAP